MPITSDTQCRHAITHHHSSRFAPTEFSSPLGPRPATVPYKLFKALRRFQTAFPPPLPNLTLTDGIPLLSDTALPQAFAEHVAALQHGAPNTPEVLTLPTTSTPTSKPHHANYIYPTAYDMARAMRRLVPRRAPDHGGIPSDVLRTCSDVLYPDMHQFITKTSATGHGPIAWRGTIAIQTPPPTRGQRTVQHQEP